MKTLLALAVAMAVSCGPALAQADPVPPHCLDEPETTGALPADPRSLYRPGERPVKAEGEQPDESWQAEARESFEQRQQDLLACGVD